MRKIALALIVSIPMCLTARAAEEPAVGTTDPNALRRDTAMVQQVPDSEWYRSHEWDLSIWGTYVWSANPGTRHVDNDDPFSPGLDPEILVGTTISTTFTGGNAPGGGGVIMKPRATNPDTRIDLGQTRDDTFLAKDNSFGGGVDIKYFWSRYFGAGVQGFLVDTATDNIGGAGLGTFTVRYPFGRFAPYIWGGGGAITGGGRIDRIFHDQHKYTSDGFVKSEREFFDDEIIPNRKVYFDGQVGIGVEVRVTQHIGMMADFAWNFVLGHDGNDTHKLVATPGGTNFDSGDPISFPNNTAIDVVPNPSSDNKDFGMVRFGLNLSY